MIQNTHIVQYNIHIQYPYIVGKYKINWNELKKQVETGAFDDLFYFRSECKLILYLLTMYVYCAYPAISKGKKQLPNCLQIAEASISALSNASSVTSTLILLRIFVLLNMNQEPEMIQ